MKFESGQRLLHYRIDGVVGQGGMGVVYAATDLKLGRRVALKVLPGAVESDSDRRSRFEWEARAIAALNHPNIVTLHSIEESDGIRFLTMELIEGRSLKTFIDPDGMSQETFLELAIPVTEALASAHSEGIVHRDIKPDNIVVSHEGVPKILDFGLAKMRTQVVEDKTDPMLPTHYDTRTGEVIGTLAYMSPEQLRGVPIQASSDVFSLGTLMYELLAGTRPFERTSNAESLVAILREQPTPLAERRPDLSDELTAVIDRCLAKSLTERYASAGELLTDLTRSAENHAPSPADRRPARRRPRLRPLVAVSAVLGGLLLLLGWQVRKHTAEETLRVETLPEIERLNDQGEVFQAFLRISETRLRFPDDVGVEELFGRTSVPVEVSTEPPGATVFFTDYRHPDLPEIQLGPTPIAGRLPLAHLRYRVELEGYETAVGALPRMPNRFTLELQPADSVPSGMVWVPGLAPRPSDPHKIALAPFWIDRFEVTNREYQRFVRDGGYRDESLWPEAFAEDGSSLPFSDLSQRLVDQTGRTGPATWHTGTYPEGEGDQPVRGVSWYEAAAYSRWAGKSLPTIHHWHHAAGRGIFADILVVSNFDGEGPAEGGTYAGLGPYGTFDMAGNVWEWCWNLAGDARYIQGGAWNEPSFSYSDDRAIDPLSRQPELGFRTILLDQPASDEALAPINSSRFDFNQIEVASDELFELMVERYQYQPRPLEVRSEGNGAGIGDIRRQTVSVEAAYSGPRLLIHLYLPVDAEPPFQTVVFRPPSSVNFLDSIDDFRSALPAFVPRSGRALVIPAYWGTLERRDPEQRNEIRVLRQVLDLRRTIDYLETRDEFDLDRLAFYGISAGGEYGPIFAAVEPRLSTAIWLSAGYHDLHMLAEPRDQVPWHFAPRVDMPVLMINGSDDFLLPLELAQKPLFDALATPEPHKRHVLIDGGHVPFERNDAVKEALDWLDRYLGTVGRDQSLTPG